MREYSHAFWEMACQLGPRKPRLLDSGQSADSAGIYLGFGIKGVRFHPQPSAVSPVTTAARVESQHHQLVQDTVLLSE